MIGLDTNVLVRFFAQDDPKQSAAATRLIDGLSKDAPAFVSIVTLCELAWVLDTSYGLGKPELLAILRQLLESDEILIEEKPRVWAAYGLWRAASLDLSDALVLEAGKQAGCSLTYTFDKAAARVAGFAEVKLK